jgi:hypothetical protein
MGKALPNDFDLLSYFSRAFDQVLAGAEQLLIYATQAGIAVESEVSARILTAKRDARARDEPVKVRPVTAHSLASCRTIARLEIRRYTRRLRRSYVLNC